MHWDLLDPRISYNDLVWYVSHQAQLRINTRLNRESHQFVDDKIEFYRRCAASAVPVPETLGIFSSNGPHVPE